MTTRQATTAALALLLLAGLAAETRGQTAARQGQILDLPQVSPRASVGQRLGLTDVSVTYHRPAVNGRDVWAAVIPAAGTPVWRTGANENTLISFSTDVTVGGKALQAGTYGLHSIPGKNPSQDAWTIIFSHDTQAWGSFAYDQARDALRVEVTPRAADPVEHFQISFEDLTADSMAMVLAWSDVAVPVEIAIDREATVLADLRAQLKGLTQFFWSGWNQAANYVLTNDLGDIDEALGWADRSIQAEERFGNLSTKAALLAKKGDKAAAGEIMARALELGNPGQLHNYGRQLLGRGEIEEALAVFKSNAERHPDTWFVGVGLARAYSAAGDFANAAKSMKEAQSKAPEGQKQYIGGLVSQLEAGTDIN